MFALHFRFPAGRYHATPWRRHVNEAAVAWPPEPWRILRALIAVWHRKADRGLFPEAVLAGLIDRLSESLPRFRLPQAVHAHTRHFMPWFKKGPEDRTLVFDGFLRVRKDDPLVVWWPDAELNEAERALAGHLAGLIDYLGRSESWVEAYCTFTDPGPANCEPSEGDRDGETVTLLAPLTPAAWSMARDHLVSEAQSLSRGKRAARMAVLGPTLLDALRPDTADWQQQGFGIGSVVPPAARQVTYRRSLPEKALASWTRSVDAGAVTTLRFVLAGKPLPLLTDAVRVAELMKRALMSKEETLLGADAVCWQISGHGTSGSHAHAFFLPEDADDDGHIDHVTVHAEAGIPARSVAAHTMLRTLFDGNVERWRVALEAAGTRETLVRDDATALPVGSARIWESRTPYLHPWHCKAGFGPEEQLRRELAARGLPVPCAVESLERIAIAHRGTRPSEFRRWRSKAKGGGAQPDTHGSLWRLTFDEPVPGPLAFGFACHYGLGMFRPLPELTPTPAPRRRS